MKKPEGLKALLDIYLFSDIDDEEELDNYLKANDIDFESFCNKIEKLAKHKKAELRIEEGRRFAKDYVKYLTEIQEDKRDELSINESTLALAYRKKSGEEDSVEDSEAKKMELIRKAKGKEK